MLLKLAITLLEMYPKERIKDAVRDLCSNTIIYNAIYNNEKLEQPKYPIFKE